MMSDPSRDIWSEFIATGGAETLFETYGDDDELAAHINSLPRAATVTADQIRRDRQRFHGRPRRGDVVAEEEASPTKNVIRNKARQLVVREALLEILDNIFDNFERNRPDKLQVTIVVYPATDVAPAEIVITENSGGIEKRRILPLIMLGFPERSARGIGAWGEGFKMAIFALGQEVEVYSSYPGEEPMCIHFPRGWLDPGHALWRRWRVNTHKVERNPPSEGTTIIRIGHIHSAVIESLGMCEDTGDQTTDSVCNGLAKYFAEVYAEKYYNLTSDGHDISIRITIGSASTEVEFAARVRTRLADHLAFLPWLRPIHWTAEWETQVEEPSEEDGVRTAKLTVEVYAGLAAIFDEFQSYSPHPPGIEMWGNGRLFTLKGRITDESVGWGYKFGGAAGTNPGSTASSRRLTIVALFTADDSRDVPWAAPVKNDYNRRSDFYAEIRALCAKVIRLFKDGVTFHKGRLHPFSQKWAEYTEAEKLDLLFADSDATPAFKQAFAESRFGGKVLGYRPGLSFKEIRGKDADPTVKTLYGVSTTGVKHTVQAAKETKESAEQVVQFLKAVLPHLARQAQLEELFELTPEEQLEL
jgi:hypothetical protein